MAADDDAKDAADAIRRMQCPKCGSRETIKAALLTERFTYLRCAQCGAVWAIRERRKARRPPP